ncbi:MAG TPA: ABC transporter substrate-binding protein [Candidatus Saccharimonadales bacterium]|nr:ABC transporter substrate-binding protein [Candidatus Saccharimonadales bacterium]
MRVRAMALATVAALLFGACSSTPAATTAPSAAPPSTAPTTAATPAATSAGSGTTGSQLTFSEISNDFPTCFHPICFQTGDQFIVFQLLFNSLVRRDQNEKIIPSLADSWEVSPDATTFTFHLNKSAAWSDGTPVTADDVVYTVTEALKDQAMYAADYPITAWLATKTVVAVDANTVKFTLTAPNSVFLENLTDPAHMIMPKHILSSIPGAQLATSDFANGKGVVGSGPYTLTAFTPRQVIEFTANPHYFLGAPTISKLFFRLKVSPDTAAAQVQSGELGLALEMNPTDFNVLQKAPGIKVVQVPGVGQETLQYLTTNPQISDPRVRQAINYAFDRKTLLATVFQGAGRLLWVDAGFDPSDPKLDHYDYNPDKAKSLLAAAAADGKYDPNTPIRIIYSTQQAGWPDIAAALDHDLTAIGMKHTMIPSDDAAWEAAIAGTGYEVSIQCCGSPGLGPWKAAGIFSSVTPVGTKFGTPALDALFAKAAQSGDPTVQQAAYTQAGEIINAGAPYDWLWAVAHTDAYTSKLTPMIYPNARESFAQIEKWTLAP